MRLTKEEEASAIESVMPFIESAVTKFMAKCGTVVVRVSREDFIQEACIAYLKYIRSAEDESALKVFPYFDIRNAMCCLIIENQPLSSPKRTESFKNVIHSMPQTISIDVSVNNGIDVNGMKKFWVDDANMRMDFYSFMALQDENIQKICAMRMLGASINEIADEMNTSSSTIRRNIKQLRETYDEMMEQKEES